MTFAVMSVVGRLVREPEMTCFSSGRNKTTFTVAINHPGRKLANGSRTEGAADFIRVEVWGKLAEIAHKYLAKGNQVTVCGSFRMDKWMDKEGRERMTPLVEAQHLALPPRLRVIDRPTQSGDKPITGELIFPDEPEEGVEYEREVEDEPLPEPADKIMTG